MVKPPSTLVHTIQLMDCFTKDEPYLGVREAARLTGISSSTTGRILASLRDLGLLVQDMNTRQYALAGKVLAWAEVYSATLDVRRVAQPFIYDLQRLTGETISLYILEGAERVCVERLESEKNVRVVARVGRYLPLHAGSAGKLFLAYLPDEKREQIFEKEPREPFTPYTLTDVDDLRHQVKIIREQGYAISHGEWTVDASGVAAPIFNQRRQIIAALTVSGPTPRFNPESLERFTKTCTRTALQISRLLGYNPTQRKIGVQSGR
jgi:IclR family transcriptional regulator, KDG regulon repressor